MSKHKNVHAAAPEPQVDQAAQPAEPAQVDQVAKVAEVADAAPAAHVSLPEAPAAAARVASTLYDVGVTWAQKGIGLGKTALENLARVLDRTAKRLGDLQTQIKATTEKSAA
ncbi:MAG: hypothetical protein ACMG6S_21280 [Byssovorax sp.]